MINPDKLSETLNKYSNYAQRVIAAVTAAVVAIAGAIALAWETIAAALGGG